MSAKAYAILAALIFLLAAAGQGYRAYTGLAVNVGDFAVPVMASWIASGVLVLLAVLGLTARRG
jgi:hypothetical protein